MPSLLQEQNPEALLQRIQQESAKNQQLVGRFKLRGTGLKKLLGSIDLDIIVKQPHFIYLSIDSFFKQPARIVTYDGTQLYGLEEKKLEALLTLPVEPSELVELLLRDSNIDRKTIQKLIFENNTLKITYKAGHVLSFLINSHYEIQKRELRDNSDQLIYSVIYENFPHRFYLEARYKNQKHAMTLTSEDVKLNQGVFDDKLFRR
ncbi:MAG: hypothetical protein WCK49_02765 [Myxococcaceae bacterium]